MKKHGKKAAAGSEPRRTVGLSFVITGSWTGKGK